MKNLKLKIVLLGDFFLDEYVHGYVERKSPEADVDILNIKKKHINLGSAKCL